MIVCKFGGSSVAQGSESQKVMEIINANPDRKVVVVSAPGKRFKEDTKITDLLYQSVQNIEAFDTVAKRFEEIAAYFNLSPAFLGLEEVRAKIQAGAGADYAASRGEYLSAKLMAKVLGFEFLDTALFIVINPDSTVNEKTWTNFQSLDKEKNYVVPGFYGSDTNGQVKTFSRGGSDITGSILSRAFGAKLYENWTDVSGVYTADPRIIKDARPIDVLTREQVRLLAEYGASVLHPSAVLPLEGTNIPINVKNTQKPSEKGTLIVAETDQNNGKILGVSAKEEDSFAFCAIVGPAIDSLFLQKVQEKELPVLDVKLGKGFAVFKTDLGCKQALLEILHSFALEKS